MKKELVERFLMYFHARNFIILLIGGARVSVGLI